MIQVAIWLVGISVASYVISRFDRSSSSEKWDGYIDTTDGVTRALGRAARPLSGTKVVRTSAASPQFQAIDRRLRLGGAFSGSMEIYVSIQLLTIIVGIAFLSGALLLPLESWFKLSFGGLGLVLPVWPINEVNKRSHLRGRQITEELPDFAEMLIMVLPSMSVPQSLAFTSQHTKGIVAGEMRELVRTLSTRALPEDEAFNLTAERLGTDDGRQFVGSLRDAYLEGTRVVENVTAQAESMRRVAFQQQRADLKKLPVKLTIMFALHFMPLLFALAFLPVVFALSGTTR